MAPPQASNCLKPHEEEWRDAFNRLSERFPAMSGHRIISALREHNGHAGGAARILRELSSSDVKEHDPEDIEHVSTLLSSPAMFKHACKEQFRKFDVNNDGVLEWDEVKQLVQAVYEEFGLPLPSEGSLRAFFVATDVNQDGVLSEREFRKFFEMFLRYAFFEPLKLRQVVERGKAVDSSREAMSGDSSRVSTACGASNSKSHNAEEPPKVSLVPVDLTAANRRTPKASKKSSSTPKAGQLLTTPSNGGSHGGGRTPQAGHSPGPHAGHDKHHRKKEHRHRDNDDVVFRATSGSASAPNLYADKVKCLAPQGVAFRATPAFPDKLQNAVGKGESVEILEHWVRTPDGWLPMTDPRGHGLFEKDVPGNATESRKKVSMSFSAKPQYAPAGEMAMRSVSSSPIRHKADAPAGLRGDEEEWRPIFNNLCDRFPNVGSDKIVQALREESGHAGKVAQMLRGM